MVRMKYIFTGYISALPKLVRAGYVCLDIIMSMVSVVLVALLLLISFQYEIITALNCGSQSVLQSPLVRYTSVSRLPRRTKCMRD
jgi:hypothetical protein